MAKKVKGAAVVLRCFYAGHPDNPGPGDRVVLDTAEAKRLVDLGVAIVAEDESDAGDEGEHGEGLADQAAPHDEGAVGGAG